MFINGARATQWYVKTIEYGSVVKHHRVCTYTESRLDARHFRRDRGNVYAERCRRVNDPSSKWHGNDKYGEPLGVTFSVRTGRKPGIIELFVFEDGRGEISGPPVRLLAGGIRHAARPVGQLMFAAVRRIIIIMGRQRDAIVIRTTFYVQQFFPLLYINKYIYMEKTSYNDSRASH